MMMRPYVFLLGERFASRYISSKILRAVLFVHFILSLILHFYSHWLLSYLFWTSSVHNSCLQKWASVIGNHCSFQLLVIIIILVLFKTKEIDILGGEIYGSLQSRNRHTLRVTQPGNVSIHYFGSYKSLFS